MASTRAPNQAAPRIAAAWTATLPVSSGIVLCAATIAYLNHAGTRLSDPDTQWHVAVGRWIVAHAAVPWTDLYSHTFAGHAWIAKEWLSQLVLFGVFSAAGWWGLSVLAAGVVAGGLAGLHAWLSRRVAAKAALIGVLVPLVVLNPHVLARPHVLALPLLVAWVAGLVGALERRAAPAPWLALVMTLWANLHGSYPIGLVVAGLLAGEGVFAAAPAERGRLALRWALFLAASTLAALATPYGYGTLLVSAGLFGSGESLRYVDEWRPIDFDLTGTVALCAFVIGLGILAHRPRVNLFRIACLLLLGAMMIRFTRFADLLVLAAPMLVAGPLVGLAPQLGPRPSAAGPLDRLALAGLALAACLFAALIDPRPNPEVTPAPALGAARARGLSGPVYNHYNFGGFLIAQGVPTFIDGRADQIFLGGFMDGLYGAIDDADTARFAALMKRHGVTWAIVRPDGPEIRHLARLDGWTRLYADDVAAIYYDTARAPAEARP